MNELTLEARVDNLMRVLDFVDGHLKAENCPDKVQTQIDIAVEELFVNIASYAYVEETGYATIRVETEEPYHAVAITLIDSGIPYNPLAKEDPDVTLSAEERKIGGLGIYMVKQSMDAVSYEYRDGRNVLRIRKNF